MGKSVLAVYDLTSNPLRFTNKMLSTEKGMGKDYFPGVAKQWSASLQEIFPGCLRVNSDQLKFNTDQRA